MSKQTRSWMYDVVVVGAGIAGLQAAIMIASEGPSVLLVDKSERTGGQIGQTSLILNMLGHAEGISGRELMSAGMHQATRFGAQLKVPFEVQRIEQQGDGSFIVVGENRERITCGAVVLANGVQPRLLEARSCSNFIDRGVNYGSPVMEPARWQNKRVGIVGGANSAAQAAWWLSDKCAPCTVEMFVRGESIETEMSDYLVRDIKSAHDIHVHTNTTVEEICGDVAQMTSVLLRHKDKSELTRMELDHLFIMIGAVPYTAWLEELVALDERGYVLTDRDIPEQHWSVVNRRPLTHETSVPGIFAVGDVEKTRIKRATVAMGAGAAVAPSIHTYLDLVRQAQSTPRTLREVS